jgi:selenide,water dikinase
MNANGVVIIGGHSIDDPEMKFRYAVTGVVHPDKVIKNSGARPGDVLVLTKPIGTGAISTGVKLGKASKRSVDAAIDAMTSAAAHASKVMQELGASGCTDVTGFGLLGHAYEMAKGSSVTLEIDSAQVPLFPDVIELISLKMLTRGDKNNRVYVGDTVHFADSVSAELQSALFDPQTAGGLLISLPQANVQSYLSAVSGAVVVGRVTEKQEYLIDVK